MTRRTLLSGSVIPILRGQKGAEMFAGAEAYERFMGRWSRLVAPKLLDFSGLPESGEVLDAGSGTGSLAFAIAQRNGRVRVVGIDPSQNYVSYANSLNRFPGRVRFEVGDAQQLGFPDAAFEATLSLLVFNFIPDPKKALLELRRVTKPRGKISAAVWDYGAGMRMLRVFWDAAVHLDLGAEKSDERHMPLCRAGELSFLWRQCGLENVREQPVEITAGFASFADFWDPFLLGQGPAGAYAGRLDRKQLAALRNEVKRRLGLSSENAPIDLPARVWSVCGTVPDGR